MSPKLIVGALLWRFFGSFAFSPLMGQEAPVAKLGTCEGTGGGGWGGRRCSHTTDISLKKTLTKHIAQAV